MSRRLKKAVSSIILAMIILSCSIQDTVAQSLGTNLCKRQCESERRILQNILRSVYSESRFAQCLSSCVVTPRPQPYNVNRYTLIPPATTTASAKETTTATTSTTTLSTTTPTTTRTTTTVPTTTTTTTTPTTTITTTTVPTTTTTTSTTTTTTPTTTITTTTVPTTTTTTSTTTTTTTTPTTARASTTTESRTTPTTTPTTTRRTTTTVPTTRPTTTIRTTTSGATTASSTVPPVSVAECGVPFGGVRQNRKRVIGGTTAAECEYPWMASLTIDNTICAGSILDEKHVLTAAHCVKNRITNEAFQPQSVNVRAGSSLVTAARSYAVVKVTVHPGHDPVTKVNDVAVLKLAENLVFSTCLGPICLPLEGSKPENTDFCVVAGWGVTNLDMKSGTPYLREVELPIVDQNLCQGRYGSEKVNDLTFCAGDYDNGGIDSCKGDSGAPLMCLDQGRYVVHGIVSNGISCAKPTFPGIYSRVAHPSILQFIKQTTGLS